MGLAYVLVGILSAAVTVFALQNSQPMPMRFVSWTIEGVPLASAVLAALASGLILAAVPMSIEAWRWRARARTLETRVDLLESALSGRDAPLLTPRPVSVPTARSA